MVVTADAVWSALPARIDLLAAELQRTRWLAHSVGVRPGEHPAGDDLERITRTLTDAARAGGLRPAGVLGAARRAVRRRAAAVRTPRRYDREARALEDVRREIDAVLTVRQDAEQRLMRLRDVLSRAPTARSPRRASARGEVLAKIAATEVPAVSGPPTVLQEQLATAAEYRRHAQWHRLSPLLESLEQEAEDELLRARESLTAVTAPLAVRAELRGRLDAYKAKVARHGLAEDPFLIERYDAARRMLWSAPCDLRVAEQAVLRYQQAAAEHGSRRRACPSRAALSDRRGEAVAMSQAGQACQRPGCEGSYEDVGGGELYCDNCGLAPVVSSGGRPLRWAPVGSRPTGVTRGDGRASARQRQFDASSGRSARSTRTSSRSSKSRRSVSGRLSRSLSGKSTGAFGVGAQLGLDGRLLRPEPARRGPGLGAAGAEARPARDGAGEPGGAGAQAVLLALRLRCAGGPFARRAAGAHGGVLHQVRPPVLLRAEAEGRATSCTASTRSWAAWRTAGSAGSTSPSTVRSPTAGWSSRACWTRATRTRWRRRSPSGASSPRSSTPTSCGSTTSWSTSTSAPAPWTATSSWSTSAASRSRRSPTSGAHPTGKRDPLPVEQACAYGIEALEALGHLHSRNLLYCDFKVDNAIQTEDQLKLIDMGAVRTDGRRRVGDLRHGRLPGARRSPRSGPSVASDLYTVARTLAVLTFDFQGYTNVFVDSLPDPDNIEVFRQYESFYRLLVRATDPDPARRFASAQEMAEQLTGVLREVVAAADGPAAARSVDAVRAGAARSPTRSCSPKLDGDVSRLGARVQAELPSACSGRVKDRVRSARRRPDSRRRDGARRRRPAPRAPRSPPGAPGAAPALAVAGSAGGVPAGGPAPRRAASSGRAAARPSTAGAPAVVPGGSVSVDARATALALPVPRVDPYDPNAGFLAGLMASAPAELISALAAAPAPPSRRRLREMRARLENGDHQAALALPRRTGGATRSDDWRVVWYRGVAALGHRRPRERRAVLRRDLRRLPGRARAQAGARRVRGGAGPARQRGRVLPPGVDDRPQLCERGVRPGPGAARGRGPRQRRPDTGVGAGVVHPLHGGAGRRRAGAAPAADGRSPPTCPAGRTSSPPRRRSRRSEQFGLDPMRREQLSTEVLGTRPGLGTLRWPGRRAGHPCAARQRTGRARAALRPGALVPGAGPAGTSAARRGSTWWNGPTVSAPGRGCS